MNYGNLFWQKITSIIESGIGGMNNIFRMNNLFLYITKPSWIKSTSRRFLIKCGILLNISLWIYFSSSLCLIGENQRREKYLYIMTKQYITIGRYFFSSSTSHTSQHFTMYNNKYTVPEFPRWPMLVSLYESSISDT